LKALITTNRPHPFFKTSRFFFFFFVVFIPCFFIPPRLFVSFLPPRSFLHSFHEPFHLRRTPPFSKRHVTGVNCGPFPSLFLSPVTLALFDVLEMPVSNPPAYLLGQSSSFFSLPYCRGKFVRIPPVLFPFPPVFFPPEPEKMENPLKTPPPL